MKRIIVSSKRKLFNTFLLIVGIIALTFVAWLLFAINQLPYLKIWGFLFGGLFFGLAIYIVYELLIIPKIIFYDTDFEIIDFLGFRKRKFRNNDIQEWICQEKSNKYGDYQKLLLWLKSGEKIKLYSSNYKNFPQIFKQFSQISKRNKAKEKALEKQQNKIAGGLVLVVSLFLFYQFYDNLPISISEKDTFEIVGNVSKPVKERRGKHNKFLGYDMFLNEYPNYSFQIKKAFSTKEIKHFLENNKNLKIKILKSEYQAKILRNENASFLQKYISPYTIEVVEISPYFSFSEYQKKVNESSVRYVFLMFGIVTLCLSIFLLKKDSEN